MLRAISFELRSGEKFKEFIDDLNIIDLAGDNVSKLAHIIYKNGTKEQVYLSGSLFGDTPTLEVDEYKTRGELEGTISYNSLMVQRDENGFTILPENILDLDMKKWARNEEGDYTEFPVKLENISAIVMETKQKNKAFGYNL